MGVTKHLSGMLCMQAIPESSWESWRSRVSARDATRAASKRSPYVLTRPEGTPASLSPLRCCLAASQLLFWSERRDYRLSARDAWRGKSQGRTAEKPSCVVVPQSSLLLPTYVELRGTK